MRTGGPLFPPGMLACFSPDSARTKNPVATRTASQNINLAAFGIFMLLVLFARQRFRILCLELKRS